VIQIESTKQKQRKTMMKDPSPATEALNKLHGREKKITGVLSKVQETKTKSKISNLKRSRSVRGSFDMSSFVAASQQVESSISFPRIEWPAFDGDDEEEEDEGMYVPQTKRRCHGLVRRKASFNLLELALSERAGSCGSLC
jgi:hypothetical protein